jgi:hypothetical protein
MLHQRSIGVLNRFFYHQQHFTTVTKTNSRFPFKFSRFTASKVLSMATSHSSQHKFTNRLASEQSPYLLQHAHNPVINSSLIFFQSHLILTLLIINSLIPLKVDWYPWGEEAFAEARRRDAPIFLSSNSLIFVILKTMVS